MKIASVEVLHVGSEVSGTHTVVRLATDTGVVGLGQSGGWGYQRAVGEIVADLRPLLLGSDPFRIEHLWNAMARVRPFRGNLISAAISAVDNALWDIKGKAMQVPVWELLGGRCRDKVRLHALIGGPGPDELGAARTQRGPGRLHGGQVRPTCRRLRKYDDAKARQLGLRYGRCGPRSGG